MQRLEQGEAAETDLVAIERLVVDGEVDRRRGVGMGGEGVRRRPRGEVVGVEGIGIGMRIVGAMGGAGVRRGVGRRLGGAGARVMTAGVGVRSARRGRRGGGEVVVEGGGGVRARRVTVVAVGVGRGVRGAVVGGGGDEGCAARVRERRSGHGNGNGVGVGGKTCDRFCSLARRHITSSQKPLGKCLISRYVRPP